VSSSRRFRIAEASLALRPAGLAEEEEIAPLEESSD